MPLINPYMLKTIVPLGDPRLQPGPDVRSIVQELRMRHPAGVNTALIGLASTNAFETLHAPGGIVAILIGLLLPAVQKVTAGRSSDLELLETALKPGGTLGSLWPMGAFAKPGRASRSVIVKDTRS